MKPPIVLLQSVACSDQFEYGGEGAAWMLGCRALSQLADIIEFKKRHAGLAGDDRK